VNDFLSPQAAQSIDSHLLEEAAELLIRLHSGDADAEAAIAQWRQRSDMHARAWQRAENVLRSFRQVPGDVGRRTLAGLHGAERRRMLRALGGIAFAAPLAWALWQEQAEWSADLHTAIGEQKTMQLADGTRLVLNTSTAVNIAFDARERRIHLVRGEIMITTGQDTAHRPFRVTSAEGEVRPIGTRYAVRQESGETHVAVFEGKVEITTRAGQRQRLSMGEQAFFRNAVVALPRGLSTDAGLWEQGMLLARDMRLADWVEEMGRYRRGVLRCSPAVAELRVSGAFPLTDSEAALDLLTKTRPVAVRRLTDYWVSFDAPG
jgi:transmembrane sensor